MNFVSRAAWGARAPRSRTALTNPYGTTAHWEGPGMGSFGHESCAPHVRGIQNFHMDGRGWSDIAYNAVVCPHGYVFEGRWVGVKCGANGTNEGNSRHWAVCYLGGQGDPFTTEAKAAFNACFAHFVAHGAGSEIKVHRDWKPTECPGNEIAAWVAAGRPSTSPTSLEDDMPTIACVDVVTDPTNPRRGYKLVSDGSIHPFGMAGTPAPPKMTSPELDAVWADWRKRNIAPAIRLVMEAWGDRPKGWVFASDGTVFPVGGAPQAGPTNGWWPRSFLRPQPVV